jgi:hypothetical protein
LLNIDGVWQAEIDVDDSKVNMPNLTNSQCIREELPPVSTWRTLMGTKQLIAWLIQMGVDPMVRRVE